MARKAFLTCLALAGLALSAALGPAKTCSTGVAEEDPTAVSLRAPTFICLSQRLLRLLLSAPETRTPACPAARGNGRRRRAPVRASGDARWQPTIPRCTVPRVHLRCRGASCDCFLERANSEIFRRAFEERWAHPSSHDQTFVLPA